MTAKSNGEPDPSSERASVIPDTSAREALAADHTDLPIIKLVAIDLDGTLLDKSKKVCAKAAVSLRALPATGVKVVIASARPPRSVRHIYQQLGLDTLQINYNGALIWDEPNRQ